MLDKNTNNARIATKRDKLIWAVAKQRRKRASASPGDWATFTVREKKPANFGNVPGTARAATDKVVSTTAGDSGIVLAAIGDVSEETAPDRGSQPHVRLMVRGKARTNVEFGAKLAIMERYRERYGVYPEAVLADKIY